jgi:tripartite-type tricarboxylate transporter receptor subunit TctC
MSLQKTGFGLLTVLIALALSGHGGRSQTTGTIKIIVPGPPGASTDTVARLLGEQVGRAERLTIVVENRPGAGNVIGTEAASRAAPDGNTLLINANPFVIDPHLRKLSYDPLTSFEPICHLVNSPLVIVVNSASPYRTLGDLLGAAHAKPGELTLAAVGPGTASHIGFEVLKRAAKVDITFVPYLGNAPAISALMGQHVTSALTGYTVVAEQLKSGKLRALASATRTRSELLPDVPTVAESGYKDCEVDFWNGLVAPAKTPKATISQLADWFTTALHVPEIKARLLAQGLFPVGTCGADFAAHLRRQFDEYGRVIREANIRAN